MIGICNIWVDYEREFLFILIILFYLLFYNSCVYIKWVLLYLIGYVKNYVKWGIKYFKVVIVKKKFL